MLDLRIQRVAPAYGGGIVGRLMIQYVAPAYDGGIVGRLISFCSTRTCVVDRLMLNADKPA